jgi:predicted PurR-regulated permease PerM
MILAVIFIWYSVSVLLLLFVGVLFAALLRGISNWLARKSGMGEQVSLAIVLCSLLLLTFTFGKYLVPQIVVQVDLLATQIPEATESVTNWMGEREWGRWILTKASRPAEVAPSSAEVLSRVTGVISSTVTGILSVLIVIIVSFYLALSPALYTSGLLRLVPMNHRERAREIMGALGLTLRFWLLGQFSAMTVVGVLTWLGLWLLDVPLAFSLGVLAGLLDFIPNFGPWIAAIPAVLIAFAQSPETALYVAILYLVVQHIEGFLLTPLIQQKTVSLPPVLTIAAQLALGILAGPLGLLLATPLLAVTFVLVQMLYVEDTLGDELDTPDDHLRRRDLPPLPQST